MAGHVPDVVLVEDCLELVVGMGLDIDVQGWREVLMGFVELEFCQFSLSVKYLDLVLLPDRTRCFSELRLAPTAYEFARWMVRNRYDRELALQLEWAPNSAYRYCFGEQDCLLLVEKDGVGFSCADLGTLRASPLRLGFDRVSELWLPSWSSIQYRESIAVQEKMDQVGVCGATCLEDVLPIEYVNELHRVAECGLDGTTVADLFAAADRLMGYDPAVSVYPVSAVAAADWQEFGAAAAVSVHATDEYFSVVGEHSGVMTVSEVAVAYATSVVSGVASGVQVVPDDYVGYALDDDPDASSREALGNILRHRAGLPIVQDDPPDCGCVGCDLTPVQEVVSRVVGEVSHGHGTVYEFTGRDVKRHDPGVCGMYKGSCFPDTSCVVGLSTVVHVVQEAFRRWLICGGVGKDFCAECHDPGVVLDRGRVCVAEDFVCDAYRVGFVTDRGRAVAGALGLGLSANGTVEWPGLYTVLSKKDLDVLAKQVVKVGVGGCLAVGCVVGRLKTLKEWFKFVGSGVMTMPDCFNACDWTEILVAGKYGRVKVGTVDVSEVVHLV